MSRGDAWQRGVEYRPIENVGHGTNHVAGGVAGEVGVGVECDHVAHLREEPRAAGHAGEPPVWTGERRTAEDRVHIGQFAPLSFASHPDPFTDIPLAAAVQQEKLIVVIGRVAFVERVDARRHLENQRLIGGQRFRD